MHSVRVREKGVVLNGGLMTEENTEGLTGDENDGGKSREEGKMERM